MLDTLVRQHPRIILTDARVAELKELVERDPVAQKMLRDVVARADELVLRPTVVVPASGGDLGLASACIDIVHTCGLAWRMTGDDGYFACVRRNILAICAAPMWPRGDCLGIAEVTFAIAAAYDWCFHHLADVDRESIRRYLVDGVLGWAATCYDEGDWWIDTWININLETNGGIITAALAVADTDPDAAMRVLPRAVHWMARAFDSYEPDGAWPEGAGYWARSTIYSVFALAAMSTALGTDFGLSDRPAFANTPLFMIASIAPNDLMACYADCTERRVRMHLPLLQWMATRYGRPEYAQYELARVATTRATATNLIWYDPTPQAPAKPFARDLYFRGQVDFVSMRSAWDDRDAIHVWTKGGFNQINHGHLDLGAFEFDALGERWARDLGTDDYALPGYFDSVPGGRRWSYYRLGSLSHNVPQLDGANQHQAATARITTFVADPTSPRAVVEFAEAYHPIGSPARRGYMLVERRALLVQDEFHLTRACRFTWGMTTDAVIAADGASATLTLNGKEVVARILEPAGALFSAETAQRSPPEKTNAGVSRLVAHIAAGIGLLRVVVLLSPRWPDGTSVESCSIAPLGRWVH